MISEGKIMKKLSLPKGFSAAGVSAGIKPSEAKDMALIVSDTPATSAGVFTTNQIKASPVLWDVQVVEQPKARAIVMNSGNANACTGEKGKQDTEAMARHTAANLGMNPLDVFVCSTGTIGKPLPMDTIINGIDKLTTGLSTAGAGDAAEAMMTTDLVPKSISVEIEVDGKPVRITGLAKGSGMIEPNMATMLAFILTDANVEKHALQCALRTATDHSFNRISVDGDQSTNDSVIVLANGQSGTAQLTPVSEGWQIFTEALEKVLFDLAMKIVKDGEGATRVVTVHVQGAASAGEANEAARSVANSMLNKTAWAGTRPNWGRIMDAIGYSHAQVQENLVDITYNAIPAVRGGVADSETDMKELVRVVSQEAFTIYINLNIGHGEAIVYTCNCTEDYVRINVE
jgi:glutamate N-acetyltransferase/amino-acid N-acetyltransferase